MDNEETVFDQEQSPNEGDSLRTENNAVISEVQAQLQAAIDEKASLESRIGDLVRRHGQEKAEIVAKWEEWGANTSAYYAEKMRQMQDHIADLEGQLVDALPSEGARAVLESRREREAREKRESEEFAAKQDAQRRERETLAAEKARIAEDFELEPADLLEATTVADATRLAARLARQRDRQTFEERIAALAAERQAQSTADDDDSQVERQERNSRVPGATGSTTPPPQSARRETQNEVIAGLRELEERLAEAKKRRNMAATAHIMGNIVAYKRQHNLR